jgi:Holliday junction resolvase RusA-like endonuclease
MTDAEISALKLSGVWTWGPEDFPFQLASKSNGRAIVRYKGHPAIKKSDEAIRYQEYFSRLYKAARPFLGPVCMVVRAYYKDRRRDLDIALVQDALQKAGIIGNDRQVIEIHATRHLDKQNPRTWVFCCEVPEQESR